jgi:hypothetical protein
MTLTLEEKATNNDTFRHIERVRNLLNRCVTDLLTRGEKHDQTKLEPPEVSVFTEYTEKLATSTYGSEEYEGFRKAMKPALDHHYANNSHHPEYIESKERWVDIPEYEGHYQISSLGRVKSLERVLHREKAGDFIKRESIMKANITPKGYARIMLTKLGQKENRFVHALVAESFLPVDDGRTQVNHKNGNKLDNSVDNLEWVTASENLQHAYDTGLKEPKFKYVVHCKELDITTMGCLPMEKELRARGYDNASAAAIWRCIATDTSNYLPTHLDLTFDSYNIDEYKEMNSMVNHMTLLDLVEMICDWKAASERHNNGNIRKSIEVNGKRFEMSPQLIRIFENTADLLFK